jgi:hypothetical protein
MFTDLSRFAVLLMLAVFVAVFSTFTVFQPRVQAQDDMMGTHVCDSTLILLLFIAQHDYGFEYMMDASNFEKGQFAPLFEAMMMGDDMMGDEMMDDMGDDMMDDMGDDMMDDMGDDMMMVTLTPGHIDGEDEACTTLREEIESFLVAKLLEDVMMGQ